MAKLHHPQPNPEPWEHHITKKMLRDPSLFKLCDFAPAQFGHGHLLGLELTTYLGDATTAAAAALSGLVVERRLERDIRLPELIEFSGYVHDAYYLIQGLFDSHVKHSLDLVSITACVGDTEGVIQGHAKEIRALLDRTIATLREMLRRADTLKRQMLDKMRRRQAFDLNDEARISILLEEGVLLHRQAFETMNKASELADEMDTKLQQIWHKDHVSVRARPACNDASCAGQA